MLQNKDYQLYRLPLFLVIFQWASAVKKSSLPTPFPIVMIIEL
jgi:hypothetical protein